MGKQSMTIMLSGSDLTVTQVIAVARHREAVALAPGAVETMAQARAVVHEALAAGQPAYGLTTEFSYQRYVPPTVNDQAAAAMISSAALDVLGAGSVVHTPQSLGGEDFAWYLESIPGALARLGTRVPGSPALLDIHQPTFDIDESAIAVGVKALAATAITALWDDGAMVAQPLPGVTGA